MAERAGTRATDSRQAIFKDGLGTRYRSDEADGPCERLVLRDAFAAVPSFEFLLRERINRLAHVRSEHFARVLDVEHVDDGAKVAIVSQSPGGVRLSRLLATAEQHLLPLDVESSLCLIQQVLAAVAELHEDAPGASHGTLATERIRVLPNGRIVIVEHVLGAVVAQMRLSPERYWKELRVALPLAVEAPLFDRRADVAAIGMVALSLLLGRPIADDEYPAEIRALATGTFGLGGGFEPLPEWLQAWLTQALSLEPTRWFASALEASDAFARGMSESGHAASLEKLQAFLREYARLDPIEAARPMAAPVTVTPAAAVMPPAAVVPPAAVTPAAVTPPAAPAAAPAVVPIPTPVVKAPAPAITVPEPVAVTAESRDEEFEMPTSSLRPRLIAAAVIVVALTSGGVMAARRYFAAPAVEKPITGTVAFTTDPAGAAVVIDGQAHGTTPTTATLTVGPHVVELSSQGAHRSLTVNITPNAQMSQFVEMPKASVATGDLLVRTDPAGAKVSVDGQPRGVSPVTINGLAPGTHTVALENDLGSVNEDVTIQPGITSSLVVPMRAPQGAPVSGWIAVNAPAELQIFENQRLLGSSRTDRIMVAAGRHDIEFANDALGYHASQTVQVAPGQVAKLRPDWPQGTIAINATPWANVTLDGQDLGETPVGNTAVPIGSHEIVFRHPQLGEQRVTATVTATTPARISVDMRKK